LMPCLAGWPSSIRSSRWATGNRNRGLISGDCSNRDEYWDALSGANYIYINDKYEPKRNMTTKRKHWKMASSGMLRRVVLVRTDVSEKRSASFIRVTGIGELGTTLAVTSNRRKLLRNAKWYASYRECCS
jgi:hypothetical protein